MATTKTPVPAAIAATFHRADGTEVRVNENPDLMRLTYADGEVDAVTRDDIEAHGMLLTFAWHGAKQKLVDAAAILRDPETGRAATLDTKKAAVRAVYGRLLAGEWFKGRGEGGSSGGLLFAALVRLYEGKKTPEDIRAYLDGKSDAEQAKLRTSGRIAPIIEEIRAERAAKAGTVNADDLLAELDGE